MAIKQNILFHLGIFCCIICSAQNWQSLGTGIAQGGGVPRVIYADSIDNYIYVAGSFDSINSVHTRGIARWNGIGWDSLGGGIDQPYFGASPVYTMARYNSNLYVGGAFEYLGQLHIPRLGKWNGSNWDSIYIKPFSNNFGGGVTSLAVINNELYVGGSFDSIVNQPCQSFAIWNESNWNLVGLPSIINYGYDPRINAICEYSGEIYLGGNFASYLPIATDTVMDIIKWDGTTWTSVGGGMRGGWSGINKMAVYQGELYVAGSFFEFEGNVGNNIQKWNGTQWSEVGGGTFGVSALDGQILDMIVNNGKLYVVGSFTTAGGIQANNIAVWDDINWCGLGSTFDNGLQSLCFYEDTLYVGGGFWTIDGDTIHKIAQWTAGNYVDQCGNNAGLNEESGYTVEIYPNPSKDLITISLTEDFSNANYSIINMLGGKFYSGIITEANKQIDISNLPNGIYIIEIIVDNKRVSKKLLKI